MRTLLSLLSALALSCAASPRLRRADWLPVIVPLRAALAGTYACKVVQWLAILAVALFIVSMMIGSYAMTYGVLVSAFIVMMSYLIAVGTFERRPDNG